MRNAMIETLAVVSLLGIAWYYNDLQLTLPLVWWVIAAIVMVYRVMDLLAMNTKSKKRK